jgi:hypothetical protein
MNPADAKYRGLISIPTVAKKPKMASRRTRRVAALALSLDGSACTATAVVPRAHLLKSSPRLPTVSNGEDLLLHPRPAPRSPVLLLPNRSNSESQAIKPLDHPRPQASAPVRIATLVADPA